MRIIGLIDSLGSGGAQRQFVVLMSALKRMGHSVSVTVYHPSMFFRPILDSAGVSVECLPPSPPLSRIARAGSVILSARPDVVISFLSTPNLIAELTHLASLRRFRLIVSERSFDVNGPRWNTFVRALLHSTAHFVVANSDSQRKVLARAAPWLSGKLRHIPNCVDDPSFQPRMKSSDEAVKCIRICVVASYTWIKNPIVFLQAFVDANSRSHIPLECDWYGDPQIGTSGSRFLELRDAVSRASAANIFRIHEATANVANVYKSSDVLCLPSLFEGHPNVVCEAMCCGLPIIASRVGDMPLLIREGQNGYLFDPKDPTSIGEAILKFAALSSEQRHAFGEASLRIALREFSPEVFGVKWANLLG